MKKQGFHTNWLQSLTFSKYLLELLARMEVKMIQVTNMQDLKTAVNQNGEMVIAMNNNDIVMMKMEEYRETLLKKDIEEHLLKAEDDIKNGRVRNAREVFEEWKEKYGI